MQMLKILNPNKELVSMIDHCQDCTITRKLEMDDRILNFTITLNEFISYGIELEGYAEIQRIGGDISDTERFVIREITKTSDGNVSIVAPLDVELLEGAVVKSVKTEENVPENVQGAITRAFVFASRWQHDFSHLSSETLQKYRHYSYENCSVYSLLKQNLSLYGVECKIDTYNYRVTLYDEVGSDKGVYFSDELNLKSLESHSDTNEFFTEIEPYGKDGLDITGAHDSGGLNYLSNHTYSAKSKRCVWVDERYFEPNILLIDARDKLSDIAYPKITYTIEAMDLAHMNREHYGTSTDYSFLEYNVGDTVRIIDNRTKTDVKRRIIEIVEHPFDPSQNTCAIGDKKPNFQDLISNVVLSTGAVTSDEGLTDGHDNDLLVSVPRYESSS